MGVAGRKLSSTRKSIHQVVSKLKKIKKAQISINYWFIKYSFNWIKKEANKKLNQSFFDYLTSDYSGICKGNCKVLAYSNENDFLISKKRNNSKRKVSSNCENNKQH